MVLDRLSHTAGSVLRVYGRAVYPWAKLASAPLIKRMFDVKVEHEDRVPRFGPAIVSPNHLSFIDPFFVALTAPRHVTFIGKAEYWDDWRTRVFFEMAGGIPVRREDSAQAATSLDAGVAVLRTGAVLGIFPEGTRSPDGRLYKGKTGAARMAVEVGCPIIPTGLRGTRELLPKDAKVPGLGPSVTVKYGKPMRVPEDARDDARTLRTFIDELMCAIAALTGQIYRDRYAYTKRIGQPGPLVPVAPA